MSEIKKAPRKLRGKDELLMVDLQVLRWREQMRKKGLKLGKHMKKAEEAADKIREERALPDPTKRKFF